MRKSGIFSITAGMLSTVVVCGCSSMSAEKPKEVKKPVYDAKKHIEELAVKVDSYNELAEANRKTLEAQSKMIAALKVDKAIPQEDKMVNAAVMLAKDSSNHTVKRNAISILGYLGGPKAETALISMLESGSHNNFKREILQSLSNMHSKKLYGIVIKMLKEANSSDVDALSSILNSSNFRSTITSKDIPLLIEFYKKIPRTNNNRYRRRELLRHIARIDSSKIVDLVCDELVLTNNGYQKREVLFSLTNNEVEVPFSAWKKVFDCLGPVSTSNYEAYRNVLERFRQSSDWRLTDLIIPLADYVAVNKSFGSSLVSALSNMKDPKAAPVLIKLLGMKDFKNNRVTDFPGIVKKNNEYLLADDAEMEKLMALRKKRMEQLEKYEKMRQKIK